jgi:hypothetical protein
MCIYVFFAGWKQARMKVFRDEEVEKKMVGMDGGKAEGKKGDDMEVDSEVRYLAAASLHALIKILPFAGESCVRGCIKVKYV